MSEPRRAVIVEDEQLIVMYLSDLCELNNVEVVGTSDNGLDAIRTIRETQPDIVLMDFRLNGDLDGVDVAVDVYEDTSPMKIVYITGSNEPATIRKINSDHPHKILIKPVLPDDLRRALS